MANVRCWIIGRLVGGIRDDVEGHSGGWVPEIEALAASVGIDTTDILGTQVPHEYALAVNVLVCTEAQMAIVAGKIAFVVLAAKYVDGPNAGQPYPGLDKDAPFSAALWDETYTALVTGSEISVGVINSWRTNNPNGTPQQFYFSLKNYVGGESQDNE